MKTSPKPHLVSTNARNYTCIYLSPNTKQASKTKYYINKKIGWKNELMPFKFCDGKINKLLFTPESLY